MFRSYNEDNRSPSLKALDREANQRFGAEANRLFGAEARSRYAPEIARLKHETAKREVDKIRQYSNYIAAGAGLLMTFTASGSCGLPASLVMGGIAALATYFALPSVLDKCEQELESQVEVKTRVEVRAVYA